MNMHVSLLFKTPFNAQVDKILKYKINYLHIIIKLIIINTLNRPNSMIQKYIITSSGINHEEIDIPTNNHELCLTNLHHKVHFLG